MNGKERIKDIIMEEITAIAKTRGGSQIFGVSEVRMAVEAALNRPEMESAIMELYTGGRITPEGAIVYNTKVGGEKPKLELGMSIKYGGVGSEQQIFVGWMPSMWENWNDVTEVWAPFTGPSSKDIHGKAIPPIWRAK